MSSNGREDGVKRSEENRFLVQSLHAQGLTDREMEQVVPFGRSAISMYRRELGLSPNGTGVKKLVLSEDGQSATCSKCKKLLPIREFQRHRADKPYPYRLSYCFECRKDQLEARLNSDITRYLRDRYGKLRNRATKAFIKFDLTFTQFLAIWGRQNGVCFYTDVPLRCQVGLGKDPASFSVDKVEPLLGYVPGNVVFCCSRVNSVKFDVTLDELRRWMPIWYWRVMEYRKELQVEAKMGKDSNRED